MNLCKCGCGRTVPPSRGYHPRIWFDDSCRKRAARRVVRQQDSISAPVGAEVAPSVDLDELLVPGDVGVVDAVRRLVGALPLDTAEEVAQAALAGELAGMCAAGSVPAARELRLVLLEMRAARDSYFEGPVSQATALRVLLEAIGTHVGEGSLDRPTPPGWRSTALDGEVLAWLGRRWYELRHAHDDEGLADLQGWVGAHSSDIECLRRMGRWATWPDARDSL